MNTCILNETEQMYTDSEHATWAVLCQSFSDNINSYACIEYIEGLSMLNINRGYIENLEEISERTRRESGWTLELVDGLVSSEIFFNMLSDRVFPVVRSIRDKEDLSFSEYPDIFHDLIGHLPLLTNTRFNTYLNLDLFL